MICSQPGCGRVMVARGLCNMHYKRWRRNGDVVALRVSDRITPPVCVCDLPEPDAIGECALCRRPYKLTLMRCRAEWRQFLKIG